MSMDRNRIELWVLSLGLLGLAACTGSDQEDGSGAVASFDASIRPYNVALIGESRAELPGGERVGNFRYWHESEFYEDCAEY
jgi:hypothetical protein